MNGIWLPIFFGCIFTENGLANGGARPFETTGSNFVTLSFDDSAIIGKETTTTGTHPRTFYSFTGLRYATPPLGEKRWADPELLELGEQEYNATEFGQICAQLDQTTGNLIGSEDCLFLNVYSRNLYNTWDGLVARRPLLPVLLYIHPGGYTTGSGNDEGPKYFLNQDVVLVTINYRLGPFGYLSTGHTNLPGNYGGLDQITALNWVRKYIYHFGGDPKLITIFGNSAGGASTHLMTMSPLTKGKYHNAIIQSANGLSYWAVNTPSTIRASAANFASRLGCFQGLNDPEYVDCLKTKPALELLTAQAGMQLSTIFSNVVDKGTRGSRAYLTDYPENIMKKGLYHRNPIIAGVVNNEGLINFAFLLLANGAQMGNDTAFVEVIIPKIITNSLQFGKDPQVIARVTAQVMAEYFPESVLPALPERIRRVNRIYTDIMTHGNTIMLRNYGDNRINTAYSYVFTYRPPNSPTELWAYIPDIQKQGIDTSFFDTSITHLEDMFYFFNPVSVFPPDPNHPFTTQDINFADFVTGVWAAFAKNGNPANGIRRIPGMDYWNAVKSGSVNYFNMTNIPASMGSNYQSEVYCTIFFAINHPDCFRRTNNPEIHKKKVEKVQQQVKQWNKDGRKKPMCTARGTWRSMAARNINKNKFTQIKIGSLEDIIEIDTDKMIIKVEPGLHMGTLTHRLLQLGLTIPVVPELEFLTVGGLLNGAGVETSSHKYSAFNATALEYEIVLADGSVVTCSDNENTDLFYCIPMSYGTLGFMTSATLPLIKAGKYVKLEYHSSTSISQTKDLLQRTDNEFIEGLAFGKHNTVVALGNFADKAESGKVNYINRWYKPFYYQHVESFVNPTTVKVEYIPTRDYYHRHTRGSFWMLGNPITENRLFMFLVGWVFPINFQILKAVTPQPTCLVNFIMRHFFGQDFGVPVAKFEETLSLLHSLAEVYPIWFCPGTIDLSRHSRLERYRWMGTTPYYIDFGLYGRMSGKKIEENGNAAIVVKKMEKYIFENYGILGLYTDCYLSREEFDTMFDQRMYHKLRSELNCLDAFPDAYDKAVSLKGASN